ncbi:sigma-70 RNA polymerase sigma factor region 4 domain-containing protein [Portibacter marinus]|uniref:hypothetical protein n=1 Tax=Portibacter marinus TaxID=2898660 RepID=UPI001F2560EF|nr:hypothetical protein [Portibacter marinus]
MNKSLNEANALLDLIRSGKEGRDEVIIMLYKNPKLRNSFKKMIRNEGWPKSVFNAIYTDSIIAFAHSVIRRKEFELNSDLFNYIVVIGKRAYRKQISKGLNHDPLDDVMETPESEDHALELIIDKEQQSLINLVLSRLGRNCREVLTYWASNYSMKEIAELLGYKSDMMARKKKYKCFQELLQLVNEHPHLEKILKNHG